MAMAKMLRLPPAMRCIVLSRGSLLQPIFPRTTPSSCVLREHIAYRVNRRCYATVDSTDTYTLWNKHGIDEAGSPPSTHDAGTAGAAGAHASSKESAQAGAAMSEAGKRRLVAYVRSVGKQWKARGSRHSKKWRALRSELDDIAKLSEPEVSKQLQRLAVELRTGTWREQADSAAKVSDSRDSQASTPDAAIKDNTLRTHPQSQQLTEAVSPAMTMEQMRVALPLPTQEAYPDAISDLFQPNRQWNAIQNRCQALELGMHVDLDYSHRFVDTPKRSSRYAPHVFVCSATLKISEICDETGRGEGQNKTLAKCAAWMHLVSKMHVSGALKQLWPPAEPAVQATSLDKATMSAEKDAKVDIYNYAAGFGLLPVFETKSVRAQPGRQRRTKAAGKAAKLVQTTIRLPERGIEASAASHDAATSEVAAALAFKQEAEKRHASGEPAPPSLLTVDTAMSFFDLYKSRVPNFTMEMEHESVKGNRNIAHLVIDGVSAGPKTTMKTKKQAEAVAYLVAAIGIAKERPDVMKDFEQLITKGKGRILRELVAIDLEADFEMLGNMRQSLIEAREAGLPDKRSVLSAEDVQQSARSRRNARILPAADVAVADQRLLERQRAYMSDRSLANLRETKAKLPMNEHRHAVLEMISGSQYSIVQGMTGSGKTTQVPQILLEDAIWAKRGGSCNIICTQPRRIAATSVARRVAEERNEKLQETVGYHVRNDVKLPNPGGSINYCTTGILLEQLKHDSDGVFDSASYIIIDEVHERDLNIDFLMVVLRKAITARQEAGKAVPKVVLMSATLDSELFARYFASNSNDDQTTPCPSIAVPGRTYPVTERHLGRIMQDLFKLGGKEVNGLIDTDKKCRDFLNSETAFSASHERSGSGSSSETIIDWKRQRQPENEGEPTAAQEKEEALVPVPLLAATLAHICTTTEDGAILVFLPGLEEILKTRRFLEERKLFGLDFNDATKFKILPLHSTIPKEEQADVFDPAPPGCRKIILSTNIAETSVTVADVKYVVDTGKLREKRYDQVRRITKLQCVWESKSNAKQRAGRAGRVQDGYYYALFSKERHDSLRTVGLPELLRSDLQETCLDIKAQNFKEPVAEFLAQAIEPPPARAIEAAVESLKGMEALTEDEELTDLGRLLSKLPVHPALGKMIVLGIIFRCLDPMLVLGAAAEERSLFVSPIDRRNDAKQAHKSYGTQQSDHLAFLSAFRELHTLRSEQGQSAMFQRSMEKYLHHGAFRSIDQTAQQIVNTLTETGLVPRTNSTERGSSLYSHDSLNRNSRNASLIKCLLLAGLHPNLAAKYTSKGLTFRTPTEQAVLMHPSSLNVLPPRADQHPYGALFAYDTLARSNDGGTLYMRTTTQVSPLMATLFGGKLRMHSGNRLEMDDWLPFFIKAEQRQFATKLILEFRKALDRVLNLAFQSLSDARPADRGSFGNDPVREVFAAGLVRALDQNAALRAGEPRLGWGSAGGKDGGWGPGAGGRS